MQYIGFENKIIDALNHFFAAMFPYHFGDAVAMEDIGIKERYELELARKALVRTFTGFFGDPVKAEKDVKELMEAIPAIHELILTDVQAAYEGDPAAQSTDEVILAYPAFKAISIFRIAHKLYEMRVPIIPRMMTEYAHRLTGIDIHPGANIGRYFFIDHGTGVVIGETTTIGEHVKLYQHVTLGAKSFAVQEDGTLVKGIKRHPDIGNNVVIYAGATILGGDTRIGDNCIVGGNVWLTHSLESGRTITIRTDEA